MKNWKLVTVTAAALSALVFAAACTVTEDDGTGDAGGTGGTGGSNAAGTGGSDAAGAAGAAGAPATPVSFAEFFTPDGEAKSACTTCLETNCAAENTACGDVFGTGACAAGASCLVDQLAPETGEPATVDCAFVSCVGSNPGEQLNLAATCLADKCATACGATAGFESCP